MLYYLRFFLENKLEFQRAPYYHLPSSKEFEEESNKKLVKLTNDIKSLHLSSDESEESSRCSFSVLSDEIILKILENLDWRSLCRVSRVDKRLNRIAQDPHLYTYLKIDLKNSFQYNHIHSSFASDRSLLHYFTPRCKYLRLLSLGSCIEWSNFQKFLISCGKHLTHLRLDDCSWINDLTLSRIVKICHDLKELDLGIYPITAEESAPLTDKGLSCLENLQFLECLCLFCININIKTLRKILRRKTDRRIRHLAFRFSYIGSYLNADDFAVEVRNSCPDLESISIFKGKFTSKGIDALADCKNLREVRLEFCRSSWYPYSYYFCATTLQATSQVLNRSISSLCLNKPYSFNNSFHKLFSSCQKLEKISLMYFNGLTEYDLEALTLCKNLKYLNVKHLISLTTATCLKILLNCPKLKKISLSHRIARDLNETRNLFNQWIEKYNLHNLHVDLQLEN